TSSTSSTTTTTVPLGTFHATAVAVGAGHACALTDIGGVMCWGDNFFGQLGIGNNDGNTYCASEPGQLCSPVPQTVVGLTSGVTAIAAGDRHQCALTTGGGAKCWGRNNYGQLGDGTQTQRNAPIDVVGLTSGVAAIAAGGNETCALMNTGGVKCWGQNGYG